MKEDKITEKLFDLLSSKSFEALNDEERNTVLSEITEEEYRYTYELLKGAGEAVKQSHAVPSGTVRKNLLDAFDKRYKRRNSILVFLSARVPVYSAAAAVFAAVFCVVAWQHFSITNTKRESQVVYKLKTDTVYVLADSTRAGSNNSTGISVNIGTKEGPHIQKVNRSKNEINLSRSIKQDRGLKQFMVACL